jgi:HK97 family phage major capsid protein/HK97 family phage prohead protease
MSYKPTQGMIEEAERGLEWRREFGRGGTEVGIARARDISNGENLSESTVKRMFSFFSRHEVNKKAEGFSPGEEGYPSNGRIAWALWGGDAGFSWSRQIVERLDNDRSEDRNDTKISDAVEKNLRKQAKEHNEDVGDTASKRTNYRTLAAVFRRGVGAYYTNPGSVRPSVNSPEQWAYARVSSYRYALRNGKFRSGKHDTDLLPSGHPMSSKDRAMDQERPYPNEHAARIHSPGKYEEFRRDNGAGGEGVDFIYGIWEEAEERQSEVQSIRFDASVYTVGQAREWLEENDFTAIEFEEAVMEESSYTDERHIISATETDDTVIVVYGKSENYEGLNVMPEEVEQDEDDDERVESVEIVHRNMEMKGEDIINEDERRVRIVMSTENPVERGYGKEVLDHSRESVDLDWMNSGRAPLLLDHDMSQQIGIVESVELDSDERKVRAMVRFGRSELAEEIFRDVKDGIRQNISVGYAVNKMEKDGKDTYRVKSWRPMEASVVSIPADSQSRVGRSAEAPTEPVIETSEIKETKMSEDVNVEAVAADAARSAQKEAAQIFELGARHNMSDKASEAVKEGRSLAEFRGIVLDEIGNKPLVSEDIGLTKKEVRNFSLVRAIRALANPSDRKAQEEAAFEFEASRAAAEMYGTTAQGVMIPAEVLRQWGQRDLNTSDDSSLVPEDFRAGDFIDVLRNQSSVMQAGARMLQGLSGNVAIPKKSTAASAGWIATEGGNAAESEATFTQVTMTPKTVGALTEITRQMMMQASPDIEALVRDDLTQALALAIDLGALAGTGSDGQPTGIRNTNGINTQDFAAANPTFAEIVGMETAVAVDNALTGNLAYIMPASTYGALKTTEKATNTAQFVVEPGGTVNGYRSIVSNQAAAGDVYFGNYSDLLIGMYGGLDLLVDPFSSSASGTVRVRALQSVDVAVRNAVSFCLGDADIA